MLLLARKTEETIMIGDDIQVKLVSSEDGAAIIGIHAPKEIPVHRQEVYDRNKVWKKTQGKKSFNRKILGGVQHV